MSACYARERQLATEQQRKRSITTYALRQSSGIALDAETRACGTRARNTSRGIQVAEYRSLDVRHRAVRSCRAAESMNDRPTAPRTAMTLLEKLRRTPMNRGSRMTEQASQLRDEIAAAIEAEDVPARLA